MELKLQNASIDASRRAELSVADLVVLLRKRWLIVLATLLLGLACGVFLASRPRKYAADGSMWIQPGTASMYRTSTMNMLADEASDKLASEAQILQSRTLYLRVAKELNLYRDPGFLGTTHFKQRSFEEPATRDRIFRLMNKRITVTHNPKDQIVKISCTTNSPELSARIVNTIVNDYIEDIFKLHYSASQRTSSWLISQLHDMKGQVEADQATLVGLQSKLGVLGFDPKSSDYLQAESLDTFTKAAGEATIEKIVAEAKYRYLRESDPSLIEGGQQVLSSRTVPNSAQGTLIQSLRSTQAQLAANYAHLLAQYGKNYPEAKQAKAELDEIDSQVKTEQHRILNQAKLAYLAADANQKMTVGALNDKKNEAFQHKNDMVKYVLLQHEYESHRDLYEGLVRRLEEATFASGLESSEVDVIDVADTPSIPKPPGPVLYLLGSLFASMIAGCSLAFIVEALDSRVEDALEAEHLLGVPLLAVLPHIDGGEIHPRGPGPILPEVIAAPRSSYSEAVQSLRASILLAGGERTPQVIMVTSSQLDEGKSMTSRNLAAALSQHGSTTLLIDGDLRSGRIAAQFGISNAKGLSNILSSELPLKHAIQAIPGCSDLYVLPSGPYPRLPAVQAASQRMADLIGECREDFDFIVLDVPPLLGVSDALSIGRFADSTIFITRHNMSTKRQLMELRERAATVNAHALGCVHNDINSRLGSYGYHEYRSLPLPDSGVEA
ncbi:MAG TPA: polysaccharide biosynthesis tyrosine autokinase [Acidobacteriaceae bacterium]